MMGFWAKERSSTESGYHPLLYHLIDVAAVTEALWCDVIASGVRRRVSADLGLSDRDAAAWLAFLAGSHDLGKASINFALQLDDARDRLRPFGFAAHDTPRGAAPHGTVTTLVLPEILEDEYGLPRSLADKLAVAVGGHHGRFPDHFKVSQLPPMQVGTKAAWSQVRRELVSALARALDLPLGTTPSQPSNATLVWLAGLVSVADWIGSDQRYFHFACSDSHVVLPFDGDYVSLSRRSARKALSDLGWLAAKGSTTPASFADMFGFQANSLQETVTDLANHLYEPELIIIEASMGKGKTEAALYLAERWARSTGACGFYLALPTQATSDQMFGRAVNFLKKAYPGETAQLQLLHGHAALSAAFQEIVHGTDPGLNPSGIAVDELGGQPSVVASEWFTHRKRGLLASFGVGTVDQILLAALQTNHVFVRLFGLAGKVVIVDEVHAYDVYMSTLLERLLEWLSALGSPVIMLSATLPESRRQALLTAYGGEAVDTHQSQSAYPRVSVADRAGKIQSIPVSQDSEASGLTVGLNWIPDRSRGNPDDDRLVQLLIDALADGGCAAVICNTVGRAQSLYTALRGNFPGLAEDGWPELDLLHARYPYIQRAEREFRALSRFGKPGAAVTDMDGVAHEVVRPHRAVLVATQVIEQSLDLDFDVLVTDMAPADLILQRAGRLHRHQREHRPVKVAQPSIFVRGVCIDGDGVPHFDAGSKYVYEPYVLMRSWIELRERSTLSFPGDIQEVVDAVYDDGSDCANVSDKLASTLSAALQQMRNNLDEEEIQAQQRYIKAPKFSGRLAGIVSSRFEEDRPDLHPALQALTRLAEPSVTVVLLWESSNGVTIRGEGHMVLSHRPNLQECRKLLKWSLTLSNKSVVFRLLDAEIPSGWQRSPLMSHCRPLVLNDNDEIEVGSRTIRLDRDLGVVIDNQPEEVAT
jgi:CRISPR-associated endonuclease/helicase Cas3